MVEVNCRYAEKNVAVLLKFNVFFFLLLYVFQQFRGAPRTARTTEKGESSTKIKNRTSFKRKVIINLIMKHKVDNFQIQ